MQAKRASADNSILPFLGESEFKVHICDRFSFYKRLEASLRNKLISNVRIINKIWLITSIFYANQNLLPKYVLGKTKRNRQYHSSTWVLFVLLRKVIFLWYSELCLYITMDVRIKFAKPAFLESIWSSIVIWMKAIIDDVHDEHDAKIITGSFSHL